MKQHTRIQILRDYWSVESGRGHYWACRRVAADLGRTLSPHRRPLARHIAGGWARELMPDIRPIRGQTLTHMTAAARWLMRAQDATPDGGVSYGYFPVQLEDGWEKSHPESTGGIMTSLLAYGARAQDATAVERVLRMARWQIEIQMPSGAVQRGTVRPPEERSPGAFNTGMALDGLVSVLETLEDPEIQAAARRAADFLVGDMTDEGYFRAIDMFDKPGDKKVYRCICGLGLYRFGDLTGEPRYHEAALKALGVALPMQRPNGWFDDNCVNRPMAPLLHTICLTLQALVEVGILADRPDFVAAAVTSVEAIMAAGSHQGLPYARYYADWQPATFYVSVTGAAQLAMICYRLAAHLGREDLRRYADEVLDRLKALQILDSRDPEMVGATAEVHPIFGVYIKRPFRNWATKFLLDALVLQANAQSAEGAREQASVT